MECLPIPGTSSPSARHTRLLPVCRGLELIDGKRLDTHAVCVMDLNLVAACGKPQACLGILDHGSRLCVRLTTLVNKRSWTLLGHLRLAIGQHGKPRAVRTDNEAIFNSFVFTTFLKLAGIRKQTTPVCAPWCNGRIERFFGTIKPWLRQLVHQSISDVQNALQEAAWFYNHVRPHQNLKGLTPKEAWDGLAPEDLHRGARDALLVQTLDGVLCGYWIRR
ncbi:transposase [Comamonadaceae bacterium OH3737_COT-264]|nr:transposase [Comamonadaceae bacterium OH3737_COT-264]